MCVGVKGLNASLAPAASSGIMLLEKQLLRQDTEQERPPKRARLQSAVPSATTTSWIELSKYEHLS